MKTASKRFQTKSIWTKMIHSFMHISFSKFMSMCLSFEWDYKHTWQTHCTPSDLASKYYNHLDWYNHKSQSYECHCFSKNDKDTIWVIRFIDAKRHRVSSNADSKTWAFQLYIPEWKKLRNDPLSAKLMYNTASHSFYHHGIKGNFNPWKIQTAEQYGCWYWPL